MAIAACIFALYGCEVDICCYSQYLTQRDSKLFDELYKDLGIKDKIKYGTFKDLCEKLVMRDFNIREEIKNIVKGTKEFKDLKI